MAFISYTEGPISALSLAGEARAGLIWVDFNFVLSLLNTRDKTLGPRDHPRVSLEWMESGHGGRGVKKTGNGWTSFAQAPKPWKHRIHKILFGPLIYL